MLVAFTAMTGCKVIANYDSPHGPRYAGQHASQESPSGERVKVDTRQNAQYGD